MIEIYGSLQVTANEIPTIGFEGCRLRPVVFECVMSVGNNMVTALIHAVGRHGFRITAKQPDAPYKGVMQPGPLMEWSPSASAFEEIKPEDEYRTFGAGQRAFPIGLLGQEVGRARGFMENNGW